VHALPDGKLGTRLPAKLGKTFERLPWQSEIGEWSRLVAEFTLTIPENTKEARVSIAPLGEIVVRREQLRILDTSGECWSELPVDLPMAKPITVRVFIDGNIIEVFMHDRYSLAARLPSSPGPARFSLQSAAVSSMRSSEWRLPD
jgi:sucrose-6-phosphate hydrolase SacC (GH32 family)